MALPKASPVSPDFRIRTVTLFSLSNARSSASLMSKESCVITVSVRGPAGVGAPAPPAGPQAASHSSKKSVNRVTFINRSDHRSDYACRKTQYAT